MSESNQFVEEREEDEDYRQLSGSAIAALLISLLSILSIFHVGFLFFAVIAGLVALFSLWQIEYSSKTISGSKVALLTLAIAMISTANCLSFRYFKSANERNVAIDFGQKWLEMIQANKLHDAHELTKRRNVRLPKDKSEAITNSRVETSSSSLDEFEATQFVQRLNKIPDAKIELDRYHSRNDYSDVSVVNILYKIDDPKSAPPFSVLLQLQFELNPRDSAVDWRVGEFYLGSQPSQ